jgi:hypothetical protein
MCLYPLSFCGLGLAQWVDVCTAVNLAHPHPLVTQTSLEEIASKLELKRQFDKVWCGGRPVYRRSPRSFFKLSV